MSDQQLAVKPPKIPVLASSRGVQFKGMDEMIRFCQWTVASRQFKDVTTPEVAFIRLQAGLELGLTPIWSTTNVLVVNGRPSVWGDALLGLVKAHRECDDVIETLTGEGEKMEASCRILRRGKAPVVRTFSVEDAKLAKLWNKTGAHGEPTPWVTYPKRMLQMRARAFACRDAFPDVLRGLGVVEEQRDVSERQIEGRVIEDPPPATLPDEILPAPVLAEPKDGDPKGSFEVGEARESTQPAYTGPKTSSRGGQKDLSVGKHEREAQATSTDHARDPVTDVQKGAPPVEQVGPESAQDAIELAPAQAERPAKTPKVAEEAEERDEEGNFRF